MTAGMLCLGSVGLSGVENVLKSVGTVLSASAEETAETERVPVGTGTTTVRVGTGTTQLEYQAFDDDTVEITDCDNEAAGELEIPAEIDGKPVTSIGDGAFSVCSGLTKITIPNGVTSIGDYAFSDCSGLTKITIPNGVTSIRDGAFSNCSGLTEITIPDSVTSIGDNAFSDCSGLTEITIPDSVTSIRAGTFSNCSGLTEITIPDSVTSIGGSTFLKTPWLTAKQAENPLVIVNHILIDGKTCTGAVSIPNGVTSIGDYAFYDCTNLTIYGYTGSYAETYAKENDIPFVSLGNITTTETTTTTIETTVTTTTETMVTTKTTTTTTKQDSETPTVIYGDITLDGRVDITDAVLLNKFCSGAVILNDAAKLNSDCDGDGDITGNDAVALLQFLVQIVQKLPYTA